MNQAAFVHPTCDISPRARIGSGTKIWNWTQIREGVEIGRDNTIGQLVYIGVDVRIGDRCTIMPKACMDTGVEIGNDVFIGPFVALTNDTSPRAWTRRDMSGIRWKVEDGASLGSSVVVLPEVCIGHHALVAAHATVSRNVPPHAFVCGSPARRAGWVCTEGHLMCLIEERKDGALYACPDMGHEMMILDEWRRTTAFDERLISRRGARRRAASAT
jgi:UDP-2-acetamido-3-amino-2,3-dideoxy-glucuronate N-acetyltransferase